jgi:tetrahydrodipicolinate N-succinyltransferase
VFFVDANAVSGLGNRSHVGGGEGTAVAVDPPRDRTVT